MAVSISSYFRDTPQWLIGVTCVECGAELVEEDERYWTVVVADQKMYHERCVPEEFRVDKTDFDEAEK